MAATLISASATTMFIVRFETAELSGSELSKRSDIARHSQFVRHRRGFRTAQDGPGPANRNRGSAGLPALPQSWLYEPLCMRPAFSINWRWVSAVLLSHFLNSSPVIQL